MPLSLHHEHPWDLTPEQAREVQRSLRARVRIEPLDLQSVKYVVGVDASFGEDRVYASAVVLDFPGLRQIEGAVAEQPLTFPYIPGLLSFREAPAMLAALARLKTSPDVLIVDGHGVAHPRRFGIACHLGVLLDLPAIGCAKSILVGQLGPLGERVGSTANLAYGDEILGRAIRTRKNSNPVYVSVGHRVDLPSAARLVMACARGYRLPEPTRLAHNLVTEHRKSM